MFPPECDWLGVCITYQSYCRNLCKMAHQAAMCDLCGEEHQTSNCPLLAEQEVPNKEAGSHESGLAYQSLPSWVRFLPDSNRVIVHRMVPKFTKLGPLIAPHKLDMPSDTNFLLKVFHAEGSFTYLDLSRKELCNWLSLIPPGSSLNRNLLACQIDDLVYYIAAEDIKEGSELNVWYAHTYQEKMKCNLQSKSFIKKLVGATVVTQNNVLKEPSIDLSFSKSFQVSPSLLRIAIGKGQVTFTHTASESHTDNQTFPPSSNVGTQMRLYRPTNDCVRDKEEVSKGTSSSSFASENDVDRLNGQKASNSHSNNSENALPNIILVHDGNGDGEAQQIVTFTLTAAQKNGVVQLKPQTLKDSKIAKQSVGCSQQRKKTYKMRVTKSPVSLADSNVVKQLPPRALGARRPRPWACSYCGQNFTKVIAFADHLKGHLLWVVGRCHVCEKCGCSYSSSEQLLRHQETSLCRKDASVHHTSENRGETEVSIKYENISDSEEAVDDPRISTTGKKMKITALPTEHTTGPHDCQICQKQFHKAEYLLRHLRKHTGDFTCQYCLKVFARKEGLQKHVCPVRGSEEHLECTICFRKFLNSSLLEQHYAKHDENKKCSQCRKAFSNTESLNRHMKICPSVEITTLFQCGVCPKKFSSQNILDRHMSRHHQQFECHLCSKPYSSNSSLAHHIPFCRMSRQLISEGHVVCEDCGKDFTDASEFRTHYLTHTHPYHCSSCRHRFKTRVGYEVHVCEMEQHCDQCKRVFRSIQALNRHSAIHGPPPFACTSCRRSYYRKESLDRHECTFESEVREEENEKPIKKFVCDVCGATLATKHSYNTHFRAAHEGLAARKLGCDICGKQFHRSDLLQEHQAVHTPPSFPCPTCNKLFKTRKSLDVHSHLHLGIKRFACKYCNKKFHQKVNLSRHERSHMPRGAVKCQYCGSHFLSTDDLKSHLLSHTILQPELSQHQKLLEGENEEEEKMEAKFVPEKESLQASNLNSYSSLPETDDSNKLDGLAPDLNILSGTKDENAMKEIRKLCTAESVSHSAGKSASVQMSIKETELDKEFKVEQVLDATFERHLGGETHPVMTSGVNVPVQSSSSNSIAKGSTVFLPRRVSGLGFSSTSERSVASNYFTHRQIVSTSQSPQNQCNSTTFSTVRCKSSFNLDQKVLLEHSLPSGSGATRTYHLNTSEDGHMIVERSDEQVDLSQRSFQKISIGESRGTHLAFESRSGLVEQGCLYEPNTSHPKDGDVSEALDLVTTAESLITDTPVTEC